MNNFDADAHAMQEPFNLAAWARERLIVYRENRERGLIANLVDQAERKHRSTSPAKAPIPPAIHMEDVFAARLTDKDMAYLRACRIKM